MILSPGTRLGFYEVTASIGEGGMGQVYRAIDTRLGRAVALKVLPPDMARDPERLARFQREARALAVFNHPHIVTVYSVEESDGIHFLTMELIEGQSLAQLIPENGFPLDVMLSTGAALADALAAAHEKGIVHRDLKPANVMMTVDGRLKVLDFGLAKELRGTEAGDAAATLAGKTELGVLMGTPAYMSPEQIAGRTMDHRTDIFSLGVVLYELASGQRPFNGATTMELASAILRDAPRPLREVRPDVPAAFARLLWRCLDKDPRHRVQTAREVATELREIIRLGTRDSGPSSLLSAADDAGGPTAEGFRVAVLPFRYRGDNADLEALADGMADEIVTGLCRFSYLRVIARNSASRFAGEAADVQEAAAGLGARYVVEGNLRLAGSVLRVSVQLVDATSGAHLWAETYDRPFRAEDIFALQDDLVSRIVSTIADGSGVLLRSMGEVLRSRRWDELTPYEAVVRGASFYARISADEHAEARTALERAVGDAPNYAMGWALLSLLYLDEYRQSFNPRPDPLGRALAAARRAVDLAPASHFTHFALAVVLFFRRDLQAFRRAAERTIALNPVDANCIASVGAFIAYGGDWTHGLELVERGLALNPHHPGWMWLPSFYNAYRQHDYAAALDAATRVNMPAYVFAQAALVAAQGQCGGPAAAQPALQHLRHLKPDIALTVRGEFEKWFVETELVEHLLEGLRKAGLDVPSGHATGD